MPDGLASGDDQAFGHGVDRGGRGGHELNLLPIACKRFDRTYRLVAIHAARHI